MKIPKVGEWWYLGPQCTSLALVIPKEPRVEEYESKATYDNSLCVTHGISTGGRFPASHLVHEEEFTRIATDAEVQAILTLFPHFK